jgi:hypothetical protein
MHELRLIADDLSAAPSSVSPLRLDAGARRPGMAHERIELPLDAPASATISRLMAAERLPTGLLAVIAIESERSLRRAAGNHDAAALARRLDWAARRAVRPVRGSQLGAYAAALRRAEATPTAPRGRRLELLVPYHTLLAWEMAADVIGMGLETWACAHLATARAGRKLWEAAAAERGQMLAEWVAFQVAEELAKS